MIYVDAATGSNILADQLEASGLPIHRDEDGGLPHLGHADIEFVGRGVKGEQLMIGIEVKRLTELTSDFDRYAGHQLLKMNANYAHRYLIVEGEWTQNKRGSLIRRTGRASFRPLHGQCNATQLRKKLITLEMCGGTHVMLINHWGRNKEWHAETVRYINTLYRWWTDDDFEQHKSHIVNYQPHGLIPQSKFVQAFGAWPGLSTKRAKVVARVFGNSIRKACLAAPEEWADIETVDDEGNARRLGTKFAAALNTFLDGKE